VTVVHCLHVGNRLAGVLCDIIHKLANTLQLLRKAIECLYSANTFFLSTTTEDYPTISYLSYFFLPQRLTQVRDLHIHCDLDDRCDPHQECLKIVVQEDWARAWAVLGKMTGLCWLCYLAIITKHTFRVYECAAMPLLRGYRPTVNSLRRLHVRFACNIWNQPEGIEVLWAPIMTEVLKPIGTITAPSEFTIRLPNWRCSTAFDIGDSKCVFKLPDRPVVDANDGPI
jgi:hypothetical protein